MSGQEVRRIIANRVATLSGLTRSDYRQLAVGIILGNLFKVLPRHAA